MFSTGFTSLRLGLPGGRAFHLLLASLAVSSCGDWLYNVALLAVVYDRTRSATWVSVTTAARIVPIVVLGPLGGALADRRDRRRLLIASDLSRAGLMVMLAVTVTAGMPVVLMPLLAGLATGAGIVTPPCVAACTARLVPTAELQRAQGLRAAIGQGAVLAGPAVGGLLLIASTPSVAILANAATFIASASAIAAIPPSEALRGARGQTGTASLLADIRAGAQALRSAPVVVRLVAADLLCSGVYGLLTVTLVLVSRKLGDAGSGYGIMLAGLGAGGVIGAIISGRATEPSQWRRTLTLALLLVSVALPALGDAPNLAGATGLALLAGGGMVVGEVLSETALPQMLNDELLGSAYGLVLPTSLAGIVSGSLIGGALVSQLGLQGAMTLGGLFVLLAAAALLRHPLDPTHRAPIKRVRSPETADARP